MDSLNLKKFLAGLSLLSLIGTGGAALTGCTPTSGWGADNSAGSTGVKKTEPAGSGWGSSKGTVGTKKPASGWGASKGAVGTEEEEKKPKKKAGSGWGS